VRNSVISSAARSISSWLTLRAKSKSFDQRLAVHLFLGGDLAQLLDAALGAGDAGNAAALMREQELGVGPALVLD
jgi:hypothetical protein